MPEYRGPMRFAHRGMVQSAPENTLEAFAAALQYGCEGIELDIRLSHDGEIVIAHDANFTRMTLGHPTSFTNARVCDLCWQEIVQIPLPYANHLLDEQPPANAANETLAILPERLMGQERDRDYIAALSVDGRMAHLMRFQDFDQWFSHQSEDVLIELEVKASGVAARLAELLPRSSNRERYLVFSGCPAYNTEIQQHLGGSSKPAGLRLGANLRFLNDVSRQLIDQMDLFEVGLNAGCFTPNDVEWLRKKGIAVLSNLGDYPAWWEQMISMNILGFKTNYVHAYMDWYYPYTARSH